MEKYSFLHNAHPDYIEKLYREYKKNPTAIEDSWRLFFDGFEFSQNSKIQEAQTPESAKKEIAVLNMINAYRTRGHLFTKTNPVRSRRQYKPSLDIENFGLNSDDLQTVFQAGNEIGIGPATLRAILDHLIETYCTSIGAEYMFIRLPEKLLWLQHKMELSRNSPSFSLEQKKQILHKLNQAVVFEAFLHAKYVGQKRFSLQGGETLIPALDAIIEKGAGLGIEEFMIGMPHRGRLNVLANILNKEFEEIFSEFEGEGHADAIFAADVKYHLGYSSIVNTRTGKKVKLGLAPNPSHLEAVDPVVQGMVKAKIDSRYNNDENKIAPILIHGDAAIAGQGVVYEIIQMSLLKGYRTGGTIHLVINNQLGFTTGYLEGRSSTYCTDVAKVTHSPVFHVNADDAEAVVLAVEMAVEYRQTFHTDVIIDLLGYRKFGHNEGDEPRFTQPKLYKVIEKHPDPRKIYRDKLLASNSIDHNMADDMEKKFRKMLQEDLTLAKSKEFGGPSTTYLDYCDMGKRKIKERFDALPVTRVEENKLLEIGRKTWDIPTEYHVFDKIKNLYKERLDKLNNGKALDWAIGEMLAYGTLLAEGTPVRLSGQDTERGTFSHRHSIIHDEETEAEYIPLNNINQSQAPFQIHNSILSEYGVLGFEYGYACANPYGLTIWEAQFGDFVNGAQIIIDQFITSSEAKWNRSNGIVLFLPHGYEGQGPEHSSARIERFLELCANDNIQIVNCTTPANLFHVLRGHVKYPYRIPLVIFTPKSLLRHPLCVSDLDAFTKAGFKRVFDDAQADPQKVEKLLFCSGKLYYELLQKQQQEKRRDIAIIRVEQLYPIPELDILKIKKKYASAKDHIWIQEEPENCGAWPFVHRKYTFLEFKVIAREESASPATGHYKYHLWEQQQIIDSAFSELKKTEKMIH